MTCRFALACALTALVALVPSRGTATQPTFPSQVELVRIDVVVLDREGKPVSGLTAADFEVSEAGKPREIVSFEPVVVRSPSPATEPAVSGSVSAPVVAVPQENRCFLIFFDDVHVGPISAERVRKQLIPFLENETREGDWVTIMSPLAGLKWTARTAYERQQLPQIIRNLKGQLQARKLDKGDPSDYQAMRIDEYGGPTPSEPRGPNSTFQGSSTLRAAEIYAVAKRRIRQSMAGLDDAVLSLAGFRGRKSLILYSEGFVKSPALPDYERLIALAQRARVAIYFVDPRGLGTGLPSVDGRDDGGPTLLTLDSEGGGTSYLATSTGGRVSMSNDVTAMLHDVVTESSAYYLLGFQPSAGPPGERKLKVRVRRESLKVRAPDRYIAGEPEAKAKPIPPAVQALGLVSDVTDVPLRVGTLFLEPSQKGEGTTTVAVELAPLSTASEERRLNLLIEARPLAKGEAVRDSAELTVPPGSRPVVATREMQLAPGIWQARVVVRDAATEKVGSVLHTFEVPKGVGLRLSSPVLSDALESARVPKARLRLDRRYRASDALYCEYRVFGAAPDPATGKPRVSGSFAILRSGQLVQEDPSSPIAVAGDGRVQRLLGFGLAAFAPGDYILRLRVIDQVSGDTREAQEAFTVVPPG